MIGFVTVWVLTVFHNDYNFKRTQVSYQLTYASRDICIKQGDRIKERVDDNYTCNFQKVPVYRP